MTPLELQQVAAIRTCRFPAGGWEKRFRRSIVAVVAEEPGRELTPSQRFWLAWLCHRYREQIKRCLVEACPACAGGQFPPAPPRERVARKARRVERDAEKLDEHNRGVP